MSDRMTCAEALDLAKGFAEAGIHAFPIAIGWDDEKQSTNKHPLTVHGHLDATTDRAELERLFNARSPKPGEVWGVGLWPGPSGHLVLDPDTKGGARGDDELAALEAEHGWLDTFRVVTASGGGHVWLTKPPGVHVGNADLAPGVEVRADDGWVVAPGVRTPWGSWDHDEATPDEAAGAGWVLERLGATNGHRPATGRWQPLDRDQLDPLTRETLEVMEHRHGAHGAVLGPEGEVRVTRPGKRAGTSATIGYVHPGVVKMHSSNWPPFTAGQRYDLDELLSGSPPAPEPAAHPPAGGWEIGDLLDVLRSYLYLDAGHEHFLFALAVGVAARASNGEPLWGLIVGPASSGKTEAIRMIDDVADEHPDELTAPGLLSWTKGQKARQVGILRRIPDPGLLTVADFSTVLATSDRGGRDQLFALLRRAYDGRVHRDLGNAPGPLTWQGRLTMLTACTPIIDSYSSHTDALGPRWLYCRVGEQTATTKQGTGRKALRAGELAAYRAEVRAIATELVADAIDRYPTVELSTTAETRIIDTAIVTCYGRAGVEREGYGRREISGMAIIEEPPRLVTQTAQLTRALIALRFTEDEATTLACRCALDSMPRARFGALTVLTSRLQANIGEIARLAGCHRHVARMALEELDAIGVVECTYDEDETSDVHFAARPWTLRDDHARMFRAVFARGTKSGEPTHLTHQ